MSRVRIGGPKGVVRPYITVPPTNVPSEQVAQALDHIAVSLSAIDHNLEVLVRLLEKRGG